LRARGCNHLQCAEAIFGFATDRQVGFAFDYFRQALADHRMVVHQQDTQLFL
jgi:hypothetical protein